MKIDQPGKNTKKNEGRPQEDKTAQRGLLKRILAILMLLVVIALFCSLIYFAVTGAPAQTLLSVLFCLIVIPCLLYAFRLYIDFTTRKR